MEVVVPLLLALEVVEPLVLALEVMVRLLLALEAVVPKALGQERTCTSLEVLARMQDCDGGDTSGYRSAA